MEPVVVGLFLAFFFSESVAEFTLNELNLRYVRRRSGNPALPEYFQGRISSEEYRKSVEYTLAKGRYERWAAVYGALMTLWILFGGVLPALDEVSRDMGALFPPVLKAAGIFFCSGAGLILSLLSLPTALYATFVLEDRFGFNKTTVKLFFADKLKGFLISLVIGIPFLFGVLYLPLHVLSDAFAEYSLAQA